MFWESVRYSAMKIKRDVAFQQLNVKQEVTQSSESKDELNTLVVCKLGLTERGTDCVL